jgi:hypothetical protein
MARKTAKTLPGTLADKRAKAGSKTGSKTQAKAGPKTTHKTPKSDDPSRYPPLGRALRGIDTPKSANRIFWGLAVLCGVLFLLDFTYEKHGHFEVEHIPGFYGIYGFVMFTGLILVAKALRVLIRRPEDFYGDKAVDSEAYPEDQLARIKNDA